MHPMPDMMVFSWPSDRYLTVKPIIFSPITVICLPACLPDLHAEEIILNGISKDTDVAGGGRHMSNHFAKPAWNIHNVSSCTGNHDTSCSRCARAMKKYKHKGVAICSQGESSVSEGYVYEAINGASNEELPVIFVFQDNGYGISVPKADQTANRKVANNFTGFKNLRIIHCNGKDVFDSMNAMTEAKDWVLKNQKPALCRPTVCGFIPIPIPTGMNCTAMTMN